MKNNILHKVFFLALSLFFFQGFAQVTSDYDKSINFTEYQKYFFEGWQEDSDDLLNEFDKDRILTSFKKEFDARGMTMVKDESEADAAVVLYLVLNKKTSATAYTNYMGGMGYGPRWGYGYGYGYGMGGMASSSTTVDYDDYIEGTLVIDMYDAETKELIWQGITTSVVNEKPQKREKLIPKKIKKLMKKFPVDPKR